MSPLPSRAMNPTFLLLAAILCTCALLRAEGEAKVAFGPNGLERAVWRGVEIATAGPAVAPFAAFGGDVKGPGRSLGIAQDGKTVTYQYERLDIACEFVPGENRLDLRVEITNKTDRPLVGFEMTLASLALSRDLLNTSHDSGGSPRRVTNQGNLGSRMLRAPGADIELVNWNLPPKVFITAGSHGPGGPYPLVIGFNPNLKPEHPIIESRHFPETKNEIPPGARESFRFSLLLSEPVAQPVTPGPEVAAWLSKAFPMTLDWKDRRPIGTCFLANPNTGWKSNPRGYVTGKGKAEDVHSEEGLRAFGEGLMAYADRAIEQLRAIDAQGVIIWDLEGAEHYHPITYLADPEKLSMLSPEMDRFADAFFKKFRDAGFRTGLTIRPTEVVPDPAKPHRVTHRDVKDPARLLIDKISYAKNRWGCLIFYLDSNVVDKMWLSPDEAARVRSVPWLLPAGMIEAVVKAHPDILLIPEWSDSSYAPHSAPYASVNLGQRGSHASLRRWRPESFQVVSLNSDAIEQNWDVYRDNIAGGDIPLVNAWYATPEQSLIKLIREEIGYVQGGGKEAGGQQQYLEAVGLGDSQDPSALPALAGLLDSPNRVVKKAALQSIAKIRGGNDGALASRLAGIARDPESRALASFAAQALGASGPAGAQEILNLLKEDRRPHLMRFGLIAASRTLYPDAGVDARLLQLLGSQDQQLREAAIESAGLRHQGSAVPLLIEALGDKNEAISRAAVVALGRIGDPAAIVPIADLSKRNYATVVLYSIRKIQNDALLALTGTTESRSPEEWSEFVQTPATTNR